VSGQFGEAVRRFAFRLLERGLIHNLSTDAHDPVRRPPGLRVAFRGVRNPLAEAGLQRWLTSAVPAAILADEPLPPRPQPDGVSRWRRTMRK
jgi:protein-tyrosine phosphatase